MILARHIVDAQPWQYIAFYTYVAACALASLWIVKGRQ